MINSDSIGNVYGNVFNGLDPIKLGYVADMNTFMSSVLQAKLGTPGTQWNSTTSNDFNIKLPSNLESMVNPVSPEPDASRLQLTLTQNQQLVSPVVGDRGRWFDLSTINSGLIGFQGGFTDGTYAYYVPYINGTPHGNVVRVALNNFSVGGTEWFDLSTINSELKGFIGGFTDGTYAYYVPSFNAAYHGNIVRIALNNFSVSGTEWFDLSTINSGLKGFVGGFTDGTYAYYVPRQDGTPHGNVVRVALNNFSVGGTEWFDLSTVNSGLKGFAGGFTDGTYAYYVPYDNGARHGNVVRVALNNFSTSGTEWFDLSTINSGLKGFYQGFTDGTYAYYVPFDNGARHGNVVRIALNNFSTSGTEWFDLSTINSELKGFIGGFTDDTYVYYVPYRNGAYHGNIVRIALNNFSVSGLVTSTSMGISGARQTLGYPIICMNSESIVYAVFTDAGLTTLSHWVWVGWLKDPQYNGSLAVRNFAVVTNTDGSRIAQENVAATAITLSRTDAIINPAINCQIATPGANATDILIRDNDSPNNYIGKLWNMMRLPSTAVVGKIYKNTGIDPDTGQVETDQKALWMCIGSWGTDKIGMRVWTENVI